MHKIKQSAHHIQRIVWIQFCWITLSGYLAPTEEICRPHTLENTVLHSWLYTYGGKIKKFKNIFSFDISKKKFFVCIIKLWGEKFRKCILFLCWKNLIVLSLAFIAVKGVSYSVGIIEITKVCKIFPTKKLNLRRKK